jgi:transcriptional regulator with XRE-family HTH domain
MAIEHVLYYFRQLREKHGLSQSELGKICGTDWRHIYRIEAELNGNQKKSQPRAELFLRIFHALHADIDDVLYLLQKEDIDATTIVRIAEVTYSASLQQRKSEVLELEEDVQQDDIPLLSARIRKDPILHQMVRSLVMGWDVTKQRATISYKDESLSVVE